VSVFTVITTSTSDKSATATSATYATARSSTAASAAVGATIGVGQSFSTPNYTIRQYFGVFDTSALPGGITAISLVVSLSVASTSADTFEVREASSTANKIAGASLSGLTLCGSAAMAVEAGPYQIPFTSPTISASATQALVVHSQNERLDVAPSASETATFRTSGAAGTVNDPYLLVSTGGLWELVGVSNQVEVTGTSHALVTTGISGLTTGDLLVACISSRIASTTAMTLPSGGEWTLVQDELNNNTATNTSATPSATMAYCIRGASDPNLTFTHPTAPSVAIGRIIAYRGALATGTLDTQTNFTTATNVTAISGTGLTTSQDDDLIVALRAGGQESTLSTGISAATDPTTTAVGNPNTVSDPALNVWLNRAEAVTTTGADTALNIYDVVKTAAGATGNLTATASAASAHVVIAGAFKITAGTNKTLTADGGSYTLTGTAASTELGRKTAADSGSYALTGTDATPKKGQKIVADAGSYSLSGTDATLRHAWKIVPDAGSYALSGTNATLRRNLPLVPDSGSYSLTGTDATLRHAWKATADAGSYTLTGTAASLLHAWKLTVDAGSYALSGTDAALRRNLPIVAGAGSYVLTGTDATLTKSGGNLSLAADGGSYSLSGTDASPEHGWRIAVDSGSYTLSGTDATLRHAWKIAAGAGSYSLSGTDAAPEHGWRIVAGGGSYAVTGTDAAPEHGWRISAEGGTYSLTGTDATLTKTGAYAIVADAGSYTLTGTDASIVVARKLVADNGNYELTGTDATPTYVPVETRARGGDDGGSARPVRQRRKYRHITARQLQELLEVKPEEAPVPTHKRVRAVKREIVRQIEAAGLLGPAKPAVARFVQEELTQAFIPQMDWAGLAAAVRNIMRRAAEEAARIEQEIEDEDEFLILMAA
jgi:hypothetical protein